MATSTNITNLNAYYKGFSTVPKTNKKKFGLSGAALIIQDLLNALHTRRGSRVMQPNIGNICYEYIFENLTVSGQNDIIANLTSIVANDPRVSLQAINLTTATNSITVTMTILILATNQLETLVTEFNAQSS
jgi:phage baseplate assembly protein W